MTRISPSGLWTSGREVLRIALPNHMRDYKIVVKFLEGYHRGGRVFGPYGAIWMTKLKSDAKNKRLSEVDRKHFERLRKKYPELLDLR